MMMLMMKKKREGLLRDSQISIHGVESSLYHGVVGMPRFAAG
jgi:hypothetical protein